LESQKFNEIYQGHATHLHFCLWNHEKKSNHSLTCKQTKTKIRIKAIVECKVTKKTHNQAKTGHRPPQDLSLAQLQDGDTFLIGNGSRKISLDENNSTI
jgi:hypothetical protein